MSKETIGIAADHGGFFLKRAIAEEIEAAGYQVLDLGTDSEKSVDYPDYAEKLVRAISDGNVKKGVLSVGPEWHFHRGKPSHGYPRGSVL